MPARVQMAKRLLAYPTSADSVRFDGRILFLAQDSRVVERQMHGEDVVFASALPLRNDVSTDEITPAWICYHYDEKLGQFPYIGLKCCDQLPVTAGSVKAGGFAV